MAKHPCPYPSNVIEVFQAHIPKGAFVLDPMAGIGGIHNLVDCNTVGIELEGEWAKQHSQNILGDATALPFKDNSFDVVAVSPAYGNRLSDQYLPADPKGRLSYAISLGRKLSQGSGAKVGFGQKYKDLHVAAWTEALRVLKPSVPRRSSFFLLNCKDFFRLGERIRVCEWHIRMLESMGCELRVSYKLKTRNFDFSPTKLRDDERVFVFAAPSC